MNAAHNIRESILGVLNGREPRGGFCCIHESAGVSEEHPSSDGLAEAALNPAPSLQHERHSMSDVHRQPSTTSMESQHSGTAGLLLVARCVGLARLGLVFDCPGRICRIRRATFVHPISNFGSIRQDHCSKAMK